MASPDPSLWPKTTNTNQGKEYHKRPESVLLLRCYAMYIPPTPPPRENPPPPPPTWVLGGGGGEIGQLLVS